MASRPRPLPASLPWPVFTGREARRHGISRDRLLRSDIVRLRHGLYRRVGIPYREADIAAAYCREDSSTVVVGRSAARLLGFPLPRPLEMWTPDMPVSLMAPSGRRRNDGVVEWHRLELEDDELAHRRYRRRSAPEHSVRLRITSPARTWRDLGRTLDHAALVAIADHLLREPHEWAEGRSAPWCTREDLETQCRGRGAVSLRAALADARIGADSPAETRLRLAFARAGLPEPLLNTPMPRSDGSLGFRPDFHWPDYGICVEYDGGVHNDTEQVHRDIRRARRAAAAGFEEVRLYRGDLAAGCRQAVQLVAAALRRGGWTGRT